jgi:hypothetical protein
VKALFAFISLFFGGRLEPHFRPRFVAGSELHFIEQLSRRSAPPPLQQRPGPFFPQNPGERLELVSNGATAFSSFEVEQLIDASPSAAVQRTAQSAVGFEQGVRRALGNDAASFGRDLRFEGCECFTGVRLGFELSGALTRGATK